MSTLLDTVFGYFEAAEWPVDRDEEQGAIVGQVEGDGANWLILGDVFEEESTFVFYSVFEESCPEQNRSKVAEFFIRLNPALLVASYELDFDTGEMRLKSAIDVTDGALSEPLWRNLVETNTDLMGEFYDAVAKVAYKGATPEAVMQELADAEDDLDD